MPEGSQVLLCLNCFHEDVVDYYYLVNSCLICGSHELEVLETEENWGKLS